MSSFSPREIVSELDRLRMLKMRVPWHNGVDVVLGKLEHEDATRLGILLADWGCTP